MILGSIVEFKEPQKYSKIIKNKGISGIWMCASKMTANNLEGNA